MEQRAPLFVDCFELCEWLLGRLDDSASVLGRRLCENALGLTEAVTLALKGYRVDERLEEADERLVALRIQLRMAAATQLLEERQALYALEHADGIGRQLGGWLRRLDQA